MKRLVPAMAAISAVAAAAAGCGAVPAARAVVPAAGSWGRAIGVPGLAALNRGGHAAVFSLSCPSAGNCSAGGSYTDRSSHFQAFVVSERNGTWRKAIEVPGIGALNTGGFARVLSVSCPTAGSCAAAGFYWEGDQNQQGFVAAERNGRWGKAIEVPGLAALNKGGDAVVDSVSCGAKGNCVAGGHYADRGGNLHAFVAVERNGRWGTAMAVPGLAALDTGGYAEVLSVSCASAGTCAAGGYYTEGSGSQQGFVADERNGRWATAIAVPGLAALNTDLAEVDSISCTSTGNCAAAGAYSAGRNDNDQGFVAAERNGRWGKAIEVPGLAALNKGGGAFVSEVSCSAGTCAAGGAYFGPGSKSHEHGWVAAERNGRWAKAIQVPGLAALNTGGGDTQVQSVSCGSPGTCAAGGFYYDRPHHPDHHTWFVAVERNGRWGTAIQIPGLKALNKRADRRVLSILSPRFAVSCPPAGSCVAGGYYTDAAGHGQGFVTRAG